MRELIPRNWCDPCDERGQHTEATVVELPLRIGKSETRTLEMCADDYAALVEPLIKILESHGAPISPAAQRGAAAHHGTRRTRDELAAAGDLETCPLCGRSFANLRPHLAGVHELNTKRLRDDAGVYHCPLCDWTSDAATGVGPHFGIAHEMSLTDYLMRQGVAG